MKTFRKNNGRREPNPETERRKIGIVVHDDRGNASLTWRDAPSDYERPVLEILEEQDPRARPEAYDPYAHPPTGKGSGGAAGGAKVGSAIAKPDIAKAAAGKAAAGKAGAGKAGAGRGATFTSGGGKAGSGKAGAARTDLRKLSDWIKMMRELEQRKRESGGGGESGAR